MTPVELAEASRRMIADYAADLRSDLEHPDLFYRHAMQWAGIQGWLGSLAEHADDETLGAATRAILAAVAAPANDLSSIPDPEQETK